MNSIKMKNNGITSVLIIAADILIIQLTVFIVLGISSVDMKTAEAISFFKAEILFTFCNIIISMFLNLYNVSFKKTSEATACEFIACIASGFAALVYAMVNQSFAFTGAKPFYILPVFVITSTMIMILWRIILNNLIVRFRKKTLLLVVEPKREDIDLAKKIKYANPKWFDSWYISVDPDDEESLEEIINLEYPKYDSILITQKLPEKVKKRLVSEAISQKKDLYVVPNLYEIYITKYYLMQFDDTMTFLIKPLALTMWQRIIKRTLDIVMSLAGIIVLSPIMLITAAAIKLDSEGKAIYSQERVTADKKIFNIYKFRTMVENAEKMTGPKLASENDDRITKVGRILRKYRIDELPQLFNIIKGDMSLVGPRPERPVFVERFCEEFPEYDKRFIVKAGLTGYAQTYGKYDTGVRDKLLYDLLYIREYSILLDLKIIFLTIKTVIMHNG